MSTSMLRSTWRSASSSTVWNGAAMQAQVIAGPSRLRIAAPRCACGEELVQHASRSSRRWMSYTKASRQAPVTSTQPSTPSALPLHSMGIDKTVPPPATVESPAAASTHQATAKPAAPKPSRPARREIKAQKAAITLVSANCCSAIISAAYLPDLTSPAIVTDTGSSGAAFNITRCTHTQAYQDRRAQ